MHLTGSQQAPNVHIVVAMACQFPHIAILCSPGMGHLVPIAEFAKRLILHDVTATLITYSDLSSPHQHSLLASLPTAISSLHLPEIHLHDLPADSRIETRLTALITRSIPYVRDVLHTLNSTNRLAAYIVDIFGGHALSASSELGIPRFIFSTSPFMFLSLMLHLPALDAGTSCEYRDLVAPVRLPGCVPVNGHDLVDPMRDRKDEAYRSFVRLGEHFRDADGILVNSFKALELATTEVLTAGQPPAYAVGPLVRVTEDGESECLQWLDKQPRGSVLLVSFGSGGTLSTLQMAELAAGLEMSGQRFLWAVKFPNDRETNRAFGVDSGNEVFNFLPEGFVERTREVGMVVPMWVPQVEVLGHVATGGFISHCGWNSTLESIVNGVPMIAWPLYAEQRMNAVMLVEGVGVALRAAGGRRVDEVVGREKIAGVVRELMLGEGGKKVREKVREMQVAAAEAVSKEGPSFKALAEVVTTWKDSVAV